MSKNTLSFNDKLNSLSQRLDHMVPDPKASLAKNQESAAELAAISAKLYTLLPDPSLSPLERIERLRRVVDQVEPDMDQLQSAIKKVEVINSRLNMFVSDENMSALQKIDVLVSKVDKCFEGKMCGFGAKIEMLGDPRAGIAPVKKD